MIRGLVERVTSTPFALGLLGVYFLVGVAVHRDYGASLDERISSTNGRVTAVHVGKLLGYDEEALAASFGDVPELEQWKDRDYGVLFEVALVLAEVALGLDSPQEVYRLRHLLTFAAFTVGLVFFFLLARLTLARPGLALLGAILLATTPKVFAHAFYNSKDVPFLVACTVAAYTLLRLLRRPSIPLAAIHGLACALAVSVRIPGLYLVGATWAMGLLEVLAGRARSRWLAVLGAFSVSVAALTYAFWPYLWAAPVEHFASAFQAMSKFRWKGSVLFQGEVVPGASVPWTYVPVWIAITVPPLYTALFLVGSCLALRDVARLPRFVRGDAPVREPALVFGLFLAPLLAVIVLGSVLYGSWRQVFFVYPFFLLTALHGARWLLEECAPRYRGSVAAGMAAAFGVTLLSTVAFLVRSHPHQAVYFNFLAGSRPGERYEMDSYGAAYLQGLEALIEHQARGKIRVALSQAVARVNVEMLSDEERARIKVVPWTKADYFITNFRQGNRSAPEEGDLDAVAIRVFEVDRSPVLGVYALGGRDGAGD